MTKFNPAGPVTNAVGGGAGGPAMSAKDVAWDGLGTPTMVETDHASGATELTVSGQAMAGLSGIPSALLSAAAGKNPYSILRL